MALMPLAASAATLTIKVENISRKGGVLRLSLYGEASWPDDKSEPIVSANVPALAPETVITFSSLKPGVYGVKTYQDANGNEKFDQNWLGWPLERYGFSRDARPFLSAPGFSRTKFTLPEGETAIVINLQ